LNDSKYIDCFIHWVLVGIIYITLLLIFFNIESNINRLVSLLLLYIVSIIMFKIKYIIGIVSFFVAILCTATEHIIIKLFIFVYYYINYYICNYSILLFYRIE